MSPFYFVTAFPFGYALFALVLLAMVIAGVAVMWSGRRAGRRHRIAIGLTLLALVACVVKVNLDEERDLNWNPDVTESTELEGHWSGDVETLDLTSDGRYRCVGRGECAVLGAAGPWTLIADGSDVAVLNGRRYNVLSYRGRLRLINEVPDPDVWDGRFLFSAAETPPTKSPR
jgi:hypothetical protein